METRHPAVMLVVSGLKSDLPYAELERRYRERMPQFREIKGLLQKYYARDEGTGEMSGIYLWDSVESMQAYMESDLRKTIPTAYELTAPPRIEIFPLVDVLRDQKGF